MQKKVYFHVMCLELVMSTTLISKSSVSLLDLRTLRTDLFASMGLQKQTIFHIPTRTFRFIHIRLTSESQCSYFRYNIQINNAHLKVSTTATELGLVSFSTLNIPILNKVKEE